MPFDQHKVLVDCQHGFRSKRSCETQLLTLSHELLNNLHTGKQTDLIILDFSKAFELNMVVRRGANSCAYCLRIREEISSGPVALDAYGSSLFSSFSVPLTVTVIKQRLQKETRRAYWNYLENIICYDENSEKVQKQKKIGNYIRNTKKDSSGVAPIAS
jgi:hypothetical protein